MRHTWLVIPARGSFRARLYEIRTLAFYASAVFLISGCGLSLPYLQDSAQLQTANDASSKFTDYQKTSTASYQIMLSNQKTLEDAFQQDFQRQASLHAQAIALTMPGKTWPCIDDELKTFNVQLDNSKTLFQANLNDLLAQENLIKQDEQPSLERGLNLIDSQISSAVDAQNKLDAERLLFSKTLQAATSIKQTNVASSLKEQAGTILDTQFDALTFEGGTFGTNPKMTVGQELSVKAPDDLVATLQGVTIDQFNPAAQPGLAIVILSLAKSVSESELQRLQLRLRYLDDVQQLTTQMQQTIGLDKYENIHNKIVSLRKQLAFGNTCDPVKDHVTLVKSFQRFGRAQNYEAAYDGATVIADYVVDFTIVQDQSDLLAEKVARRRHQFSIDVSNVDGVERQQLIAFGLKGLVTYSENGVTPEEIANLLRAAQAVTLTFIAAGVF